MLMQPDEIELFSHVSVTIMISAGNCLMKIDNSSILLKMERILVIIIERISTDFPIRCFEAAVLLISSHSSSIGTILSLWYSLSDLILIDWRAAPPFIRL